MVVENKTQEPIKQQVTPASSEAGPTMKKVMKIVKRVVVPTPVVAVPTPQSATGSEPATESQPEIPPVVVSSDLVPASTPIAKTDPSVQLEQKNAPVKEIGLPPEGAVAPQPIEGNEIEKGAVRKRRRVVVAKPVQASARQEQINEAREKVKKILANKFVRWGIAAFTVLVLLVSFYAYLPTFVEKKLPKVFALNGMPLTSFKLKNVTMEEIELQNVSDASRTLTISNMKAKYSFFGFIFSSRIDSLTITGVTIMGEKTNESISFGALSGLFNSSGVKKDSSFTIDKLNIAGGQFILKVPESEIVEEKKPVQEPQEVQGEVVEEEEPEGPLTVRFTGSGSLKKTSFSLNITTDFENKQALVKATASLNKTGQSTTAQAEITQGDMLKDKEKIGSVTGTFDVVILPTGLDKFNVDMLLSTQEQDLSLKTKIVPAGSEFDLDMQLKRSFKDEAVAMGQFMGDLEIKAKGLSVEGNFQKFSGKLPLEVTSSMLTNGRVTMQKTNTLIDMNFSCAKSVCESFLTKPLSISIASMNYGGDFNQISTYDPLELGVVADEKVPFLKSENGQLTFTAQMIPFKARFLATSPTSSQQVALGVNLPKLNFKYNIFSNFYSGNMSFSQTGFATKDMNSANVQGVIAFTSKDLPTARFIASNIALTKKDIVPPFAAELSFNPMNRLEYSVDFSAQALNGLMSAKAKGSFALSTHEWSLLVEVPKMTFSENGLGLETAFPLLASHFSGPTTGSFALKGRLQIKDGKVIGPVSLMVDNVSTTWGQIAFKNASSILTFSSIYPLETPVNQNVFVGGFNPGIAFQNALFNFKIDPSIGLQIASMQMGFADGQFKSIKSVTIPYEGRPSTLLLEGRGINLNNLTTKFKSPSLRLDGQADLEFKIALVDKALIVEDGVLKNKQSGMLQFDPTEEEKKNITPQMNDFLRSLIVNQLSLSMKGPMNGLIDFKALLKGYSSIDPTEKEDELIFDFSGAFKSFLKQDIFALEVPSDILLSLQNFSK